jgi:hypothetical protein
VQGACLGCPARLAIVSCDDTVINPWKGQQPFNFSDWWDRSVLESGYSVTRFEGMAGKNPVITALLQLNGHDRFQVREGRYFNEVQPLPAPHQRACGWHQRVLVRPPA